MAHVLDAMARWGAKIRGSRIVEPLRPGPGLHLDNYVLQRSAGRGSAGEVWLAEDVALQRRCAVKIVPPEIVGDNFAGWKKALRREATALAMVQSPNVVQVYTVGNHPDLLYYVMEWIEGRTVAAEIREHGPMPVARALHVLAGACRGLAAIHRVGVVHRDVKPTNLMLTPSGRTVVIDFGLVRMPDGAGPSGAPIGTPRYMAPECSTSAPSSEGHQAASDIYSLGATIYELITGSSPFPGNSAWEAIRAHRDEDPTPPSIRRKGVPRAVDPLLLCALAKDPRDRYEDAEDFRRAAAAVARALEGK